MLNRTFFLIAVFLLTAADGDGDGRRGNAHYEQKRYEEAVAAYRTGLASGEGERASATRYGLENNLGAALHRMEDFEGAGEAFARALSLAENDADVGRTAYNAGNNAFADKDMEAALEYYRKAMLADPTNEDAKFNYEFVKRRQQEQQNQQQQDGSENQDQDQNQQQDGEQDGEGEQGENQSQDQQGEPDENEEGGQDQQQEQQEEGSQNEEQEEERQGDSSAEPNPEKLSREEAQRILQALQSDEEKLLREVQKPKTRPRRVEKDW